MGIFSVFLPLFDPTMRQSSWSLKSTSDGRSGYSLTTSRSGLPALLRPSRRSG